MFVRSKNNTKKNAKAIQIVRSYRDIYGKTKQEVIKHIGTAKDSISGKTLKKLKPILKRRFSL